MERHKMERENVERENVKREHVKRENLQGMHGEGKRRETETVTESTRRIGEELLGAELVAGKELVEVAGTFWDTLEKSAEIHRQQISWLVEDHTSFWGDALSMDTQRTASALPNLLTHRIDHVRRGFDQYRQLLDSELAPLSKIWSDFIGVVRRDWQRTDA